MSKLIITGNGFDLAHGLHTKYSDFMNYLLAYEKEPEYIAGRFAYLHSISDKDQSKHRFYEEISKFIPEYDLWNSFEDALGMLDYEDLKESNSCYYLSYSDDNWRDSANHDYQYMIGEDLKFASQIPLFLSEWIRSINTKALPIISENIMQPDNLYLNFNYTDTLENTYEIPEDKILYIHGKALRGDSLVVGHHDSEYFKPKPAPRFESEECEMYLEDINEIDFRDQEAEEKIKSYFRSTYKDTSMIISRNEDFFRMIPQIAEIYVLRHSYSYIDFDYFHKIKNNVPANCPWFVSFYSEEDYNRLLELMRVLGVQSYHPIKISTISKNK